MKEEVGAAVFAVFCLTVQGVAAVLAVADDDCPIERDAACGGVVEVAGCDRLYALNTRARVLGVTG